MDTFFEQIISIRKTSKDYLMIAGIWAVVLIFILLIFAFVFVGPLSSIAILLTAAVIYGAYKLTQRFSVEYEYIITNGSFDVDKIIARASRSRELSFELSKVERLEKYNPNAHPSGNFTKTVMACNRDDTNAYFMIVSEDGKGSRLLVFSPDDRLKQSMVKFLPKYISNTAFND